MTEHTNKQFNADLEAVRSLFFQMGGLVESMVRDSVEVVQTGNLDLVERVRDHEKMVNALEVEIDERVSLLIARNQPAAGDLRLLLSVAKMLTDMERCGDEAEKIAKTARRLYEANARFEPVLQLHHMGNAVADMLRQALDALARRDTVLAAKVVRSDKEIDKEWKASLRQIVTYMIEDPRTISSSMELVFIARALERVGDHTKNMAERVIYMVSGDDVRHTGLKNTERVALGETAVPEEATGQD